MLSQSQRFGYVGEFRIRTSRNFFPNDVPTAADFFGGVLALFSKGKLVPHIYERKTLKISDIRIQSGYAIILLRLTDPDIPDNDLADRTSGNLRRVARKPSEDPAVSAHVVVDIGLGGDVSRSYPTCIENVGFLSRSLIVSFFNEIAASHMKKMCPRPGRNDVKPHQPRLDFVAPLSQTIGGALDGGGVLVGVKLVKQKVVDGALGDIAFPVERRDDVFLKVKNRPTGSNAKSVLKKVWDRLRDEHPKKVMVQVEDENSKVKSIPADLARNDILSNFFIHQELFGPLTPPMAMCEPSIRSDLVAAMKRVL